MKRVERKNIDKTTEREKKEMKEGVVLVGVVPEAGMIYGCTHLTTTGPFVLRKDDTQC